MAFVNIPFKKMLVAMAVATLPVQAQDQHNAELVKNFDFTFSPAGEAYAYYSYRGEKLPDIFMRTPEGKDVNLTKRADTWDIEPDFSSDGQNIVYSSGISMASMDLRVMRADGSHDRPLVEGPASEVGAEWAPDGKKILYTAFDMATKTASIYVADASGEHPVELTPDMGGASTGASWSPDGNFIAFIHEKGDGGPWSVWVMHSDGSHKRKLTSDGGRKMGAQFSPDGKSIVYSLTGDDQYVDLYSVPFVGLAGGQSPRQLTDTAAASEYFPTFTPNGAHLVFSRGDWENGFTLAHIHAPSSGN